MFFDYCDYVKKKDNLCFVEYLLSIMPTTRKKVIKTVYKDEDNSDAENAAGDFSDSGSEAEIPEHSSSEEDEEDEHSSAEEFDEKSKKRQPQAKKVRKQEFAKQLISKINRQSYAGDEELDVAPTLFSVKDLTETDKLLPTVLNLSESDSSEDESPKAPSKKQTPATITSMRHQSDSENESPLEYKDVWSQNVQDNSEEVAKKTFMELEQHKAKIEETKASLLKYQASTSIQGGEVDIKNLLAQGEEVLPEPTPEKKGRKVKKNAKVDSDSEMEDWEEVNEAKTIPQQGLQLVVDFPDAACRKTKKKLDVEMMMKRKINRVKKEYQVYMHKVHVLCWLGHGNHISRVLNNQEILAAALSLVPSKECYPGERVDMKYLEQITTWYKDKLSLNQDKNENKFRPKAPPLKDILLGQIKSRTVTTKKYLVFIFVSMLRALGLQCRVMFNFVTLPIKPPSSELCSLSTKPKDEKKSTCDKVKTEKAQNKEKKKTTSSKNKSKQKIQQVDGNDDSFLLSDDDAMESITQLDGNDDTNVKPRNTRATRAKKKTDGTTNDIEDVSPPKRARKCPSPKGSKTAPKTVEANKDVTQKRKRATRKDETDKSNLTDKSSGISNFQQEKMDVDNQDAKHTSPSPRKTRNTDKNIGTKAATSQKTTKPEKSTNKLLNPPKITVTNDKTVTNISSKYFENEKTTSVKSSRLSLSRNRSQTANPSTSQETDAKTDDKLVKSKSRTKSAPGSSVETSKYFTSPEKKPEIKRTKNTKLSRREVAKEDAQRVSHRDLAKGKAKPKNDVTGDLVDIIKKRVKEAKEDSKMGIVKAKAKKESDEDSDYLPEELPKRRSSKSDEDFKPTKINPKPSTSTGKKRIDRRVLSSDSEETPKNKCDVWCEVFVEELEQWVAVDVIRAKVHCTGEIYNRATHPVCYIVGWDNNNYLKDLTRRYVPHWNTVTRKQRAEPVWWETAIKPWLGPKSARDREEDEQLNRMQLEAPLPKSIAEYKNHPLYALKRHLLKFEAIYPPDAATLGFIREEPVYARECVYVCRSRDTWLKEAKVVRLGEQPYKVVKARPKWDKLSNKLITDKPLEVFGPWQVQDYEPPVAENGIVPRNAYGNVELFKDCMLPKGTVHIKLPGLNRVAKKLNIDCAPAMTGFDFNGGWSHPVYDGFVVCEEFQEVITDAWVKDQEEQERRELEKLEARVYGNWRRLIKGLLIRERLKDKYGFDDPPAPAQKKNKGPKLVVKKK